MASKICVEIEVGEDGSVRVGIEPQEEYAQDAAGAGTPTGPGDQPGPDDKPYLQPAQSVDDALQTAKDLLTNPQAQDANAAPTPEQLGKSKDQMWNKVRADRQTANQPGGPMMGMK